MHRDVHLVDPKTNHVNSKPLHYLFEHMKDQVAPYTAMSKIPRASPSLIIIIFMLLGFEFNTLCQGVNKTYSHV
jgi:hypothetical protein